MTDDFILQFSAPDGDKKKKKRRNSTPSRPLFPDELVEALPSRAALKPQVDVSLELDIFLNALGKPELETEQEVFDGAIISGREIAELRQVTPYIQKLVLHNPALGVHLYPPKLEVEEFVPEQGIKEAQLEFPEFSGHLPDHLPLRTTPRRLPEFLRVPTRIAQELKRNKIGSEDDDTHQATTIFQPDDRYLFNDTAYPWCTVGRVTTPGGTGSGVMVGPRHLLTCSHAIQWNDDGSAGWVRFAPSYFDGSTPFGEAWGVRVYWEGVKVVGPTLNRNEGQHDYVCVVLDRRIGDFTGWMGSRSWSDDWDDLAVWSHIGYPGDLASSERPSYQSRIALDGSFWDREVHTRIFHQGDVWPGQSGGPFFAWWPDESFPRVVADQSGENSDENTASGGAHMIDCIIRALNDHP